MEPVSLSEYYDMLETHDWYFYFSDDSKVYQRGESNEVKLQEIATQSKEHAKLLQGFKDHMFSGKPWNKEQKPRPERPLEGA